MQQDSGAAKGWIIAALVSLGTCPAHRTLISDVVHGVCATERERVATNKLLARFELQVRACLCDGACSPLRLWNS
jgi:hypothetical protein